MADKYVVELFDRVALIHGGVGPEQLETERVRQSDVFDLLSRGEVSPAADLTADYPHRTAARVHVIMRYGRKFSHEQSDYEGSPTRLMSWERVVEKFGWLAEPFCDEPLRDDIVAAVAHLDEISVAALGGLLGSVHPPPASAQQVTLLTPSVVRALLRA